MNREARRLSSMSTDDAPAGWTRFGQPGFT